MKLPKKSTTLILIVMLCLIVLTAGVAFAETQPLSFEGTVKYIALEGGFWGIVSKDGKNYDPINLAEEFKQDGLPVKVEAVAKDRVGIHMWGTIIEITAISKLENSK
ncbi:MAG: hypothetical protein P4N59_12010 [Negativicutes bacterium]|nr:hypothetical protein [Negativicutes bacterium]